MINSVHANTVHTRTRTATYAPPQRAIVLVKLVNFVKKPTPITILWNRAQRPIIHTETINDVDWHTIDIGAGMTHKFKVA